TRGCRRRGRPRRPPPASRRGAGRAPARRGDRRRSCVVSFDGALEICHKPTLGSGHDLHELPPLGTPVVQDRGRVVDEQWSGEIFPVLHFSGFRSGIGKESSRTLNPMPAQGSTARSLLGAGAGMLGFSAIAGLLVTVMVAPAIAVTGMTANNSINVFQELPDYIELTSQHQRITFVAYDAEGNEIESADYYDQNREEVTLDQIDEDLKWAAIDGEDRRFHEHGGVDL